MLKRCILAENRKLHASPIWILFFALPMISAAYGTFNNLQNLSILHASVHFCVVYFLWKSICAFFRTSTDGDTYFSAAGCYRWIGSHFGANDFIHADSQLCCAGVYRFVWWCLRNNHGEQRAWIMVAVFTHAGWYEFQSKSRYAGGTVHNISYNMHCLACCTFCCSRYLAEKTGDFIII